MGAGIRGTNRGGGMLGGSTAEALTRAQGTVMKNKQEFPPDYIHMSGTNGRASYTIYFDYPGGNSSRSTSDEDRVKNVASYQKNMRTWIGRAQGVHERNAQNLYNKELKAARDKGLSPRMAQKRAEDARDAYMAKSFAKHMSKGGAKVAIGSRHKAFRV